MTPHLSYISLHCPILTQILHTAYTTATDTCAFFMSSHVTLKFQTFRILYVTIYFKSAAQWKIHVVLFIHSDLLQTDGFEVWTPVRARFSAPSRPTPRPTQSPAQWVLSLFPGDKASRVSH